MFLSEYGSDDDDRRDSDGYELQTLPEQYYSSMKDVFSKQVVERHTVQYD